MLAVDERKIIEEFYKNIVNAVEVAEKEYMADKRNVRKREVYRFVSAQELAVSDLCAELGICF